MTQLAQWLHPSHDSSYVEKVLEHVFTSSLIQHACFARGWKVEVSKPEVDDSGYDLVAECNKIIRHIQLKASTSTSRTHKQKVHVRLGEKPSGCVVWIVYETNESARRFDFRGFRFFGGEPGSPLPDMSSFPTAKHTKANAQGIKNERPNVKVVSKARFETIADFDRLLDRLFGKG